jgi:hypothetical protein
MEMATSMLFTDTQQVERINNVRKENRVVTISAIAEAGGTRIDTDSAYQHYSQHQGERNSYMRPDKHDVKKYEYKTWCNFLKLSCPSLILPQP